MFGIGCGPPRVGSRSFNNLCHGYCLSERPLMICSTTRLVAMHVRSNTTALQPLGSYRIKYPPSNACTAHFRAFSDHVIRDENLAGISPELLRPALTCRSSRLELKHHRHGFFPRQTLMLFLPLHSMTSFFVQFKLP